MPRQMLRLLLLPLALAALAGALTVPAAACGVEVPCALEGGTYHARPPADWDGTSPLPAAIYFHGYGASGRQAVEDGPLAQAFSAEGLLLIAPDGVDGSWAHVGSPSRARDEIAFVDAVLADARARWPINGERLLVTGFSQGGSMVWDLACYRGGDAAYAPVAGAFWEPLPESCPAGPVNLRHVHGLADTVVPMAGRAIRDIYRQGDVGQGIALWRESNGCAAAPDRVETEGILECRIWTACTSGKELRLCLHEGGHALPDGWVRDIHRWARSLDG